MAHRFNSFEKMDLRQKFRIFPSFGEFEVDPQMG